jgi:Ca-activated chloride channel family protein
MTFLSPSHLWAGLGVVALAVVYGVLQTRRRTWTMRFTNVDLLSSVAPRRPGWRRHLPAGLFLIALGLLVVAWARPATDQRVPRERATIVMAIDTSLSMQATDVEPNRLEAAQQAALEFVDLLPPKLNVGLVTFNGNATVRVPPTTDRDVLREAIDGLELGERTAIGEAIFASLDAIKAAPGGLDDEPAPARIVLMSDGSTTDGRPNEVGAAAAVERGVPVSTIAFGTDDGTVMLPEEPLPVPVPVDRESLATIAETTSGTFYEAATGAELKAVYEDIGSSIGYTTEEREATTWFVGGALAALLLTAALSLAWFSRLP